MRSSQLLRLVTPFALALLLMPHFAAAADTTLGEPGLQRFAHVRFDLHVALGWYGAAGAGGRVEFSVADDVIRGIENDISLSFGADLLFSFDSRYGGPSVFPIAAAQWNFYLSRRVSLFPELGVAFLFGPSRERYWSTFVAPYLGVGLRFHFTNRNALLLRGSWPAGLQLGLTF